MTPDALEFGYRDTKATRLCREYDGIDRTGGSTADYSEWINGSAWQEFGDRREHAHLERGPGPASGEHQCGLVPIRCRFHVDHIVKNGPAALHVVQPVVS